MEADRNAKRNETMHKRNPESLFSLQRCVLCENIQDACSLFIGLIWILSCLSRHVLMSNPNDYIFYYNFITNKRIQIKLLFRLIHNIKSYLSIN